MPYVGNSKGNAALYARERDLLLSGLSYLEVAKQTGVKPGTLRERNRLIHKVNIWEAFSRRCEREGIPCRVPADSAFCSWFTGIFDGEGSIVVFTRASNGRPQYSEFRLAVQLQLREDDRSTIAHLRDGIGCGNTGWCRAHGVKKAKPSVYWRCEKIKDLREVIVPLFDSYPLRTKKAREFAIWRPLVVQRYIDTMGGYSIRLGVKESYTCAFKQAIQDIRKIRHY